MCGQSPLPKATGEKRHDETPCFPQPAGVHPDRRRTVCLPAANAAEKVGEVVRTSVQVTGQSGALSGAIRSSAMSASGANASGTGAFVFEDGTKLALGPNSTIVIDEYVYRGGAKVEKLAVGATKGTLRWISGKSESSATRSPRPRAHSAYAARPSTSMWRRTG